MAAHLLETCNKLGILFTQDNSALAKRLTKRRHLHPRSSTIFLLLFDSKLYYNVALCYTQRLRLTSLAPPLTLVEKQGTPALLPQNVLAMNSSSFYSLFIAQPLLSLYV